MYNQAISCVKRHVTGFAKYYK